MNDPKRTSDRPPSETSGSPQRPARNLSEPVTALDLAAEAEALRQEPAWQQGDRNAKTFTKGSDFRAVLTVLKQGAIVREHRVPGVAAVQALSGRLRLRIGDQQLDLPAGQLVIIEPDLAHDVEALEESAFLITIGWSGEVRGDSSRL